MDAVGRLQRRTQHRQLCRLRSNGAERSNLRLVYLRRRKYDERISNDERNVVPIHGYGDHRRSGQSVQQLHRVQDNLRRRKGRGRQRKDVAHGAYRQRRSRARRSALLHLQRRHVGHRQRKRRRALLQHQRRRLRLHRRHREDRRRRLVEEQSVHRRHRDRRETLGHQQHVRRAGSIAGGRQRRAALRSKPNQLRQRRGAGRRPRHGQCGGNRIHHKLRDIAGAAARQSDQQRHHRDRYNQRRYRAAETRQREARLHIRQRSCHSPDDNRLRHEQHGHHRRSFRGGDSIFDCRQGGHRRDFHRNSVGI